MVYISIHAPQWGATPGSKPSVLSVIYFNPRTPVGCDYDHVRPVGGLHISIHAPQWGATRSPQGEVVRISDISIHAPQWGATQHTLLRCHHTIDFNPRTPVGCDGKPVTRLIPMDRFQSTHPSGVRLLHTRRRRPCRDFNPRTPVGCDEYLGLGCSAELISIHAPQWGATPLRQRAGRTLRRFQSTHPSGVRHNTPFSGAITLSISIHAPQWGATSAFWYSTGGCAYFNPRTPVGCDASRSASRSSGSYFNPRTPVGCDQLLYPVR